MEKSMREKKKLAGQMEPTVRIGRAGLTNAVLEEIKGQLKKREAVKVKILGADRDGVRCIASEMADKTVSEIVDVRGNTVTLWLKRSET